MALALLLFVAIRPAAARYAPAGSQETRVAAASQARARFSMAPDEVIWSDFYPAGWSRDVPLTSGIFVYDPDGLFPASAAYRTSSNGGASWTGWGNNGLSANSSSGGAVVDIAVSGLIFPNSADQNLIQFQIRSLSDITHTSPTFLIALDTVPPAPPFGLTSDPRTWTNVNSFSETWTNPSDLSGIAGAFYSLNREPLYATDGIFVPTSNTLTGLQVPADGTYNIFIWLQDGAGNVTHLARNVDLAAFRYDSQPPQVIVTPNGPLGRNGWFTGPVRVDMLPQDQANLSGVADWGWRLNDQEAGNESAITLINDLIHTLVVTATDLAGNVAAPASHQIALDSSPPLLAHAIAPDPGASGWYTAPLLVTFRLDDDLSGPDMVHWQLDDLPPNTISAAQPNTEIIVEVTIEEEGRHFLQASGEDRAGNRTEVRQFDLPLDRTSPTTEAAVTPDPASSGYYTAAVMLQLQAHDRAPGVPDDETSGVSRTWIRLDGGPWQEMSALTVGPDDGQHMVEFYSEDVAGNRESINSLTIVVDATAPVAPLAPAVEPAGWSADNRFTVRWQNPADFSGIAGAYLFIGDGPPSPGEGVFYPLNDPQAPAGQITGLIAPGEGVWPLWLWLADGAGNIGWDGAILAGALRYDATPPQIAIDIVGPAGNAGWFTGPVTATLRISDAGSGPASLHYRLNGQDWQVSQSHEIALPVSDPGKHVLSYYGQDQAGLISSEQFTTLRLDPDPPGPPIALAVEPSGWTHTNQFTVTWRNPLDTSGVQTAYSSLTTPPAGAQAWPANTGAASASQMALLQAPAEGAYDLHLWLEDRAGNSDPGRAASLLQALRYDATPPATVLHYNSSQPNEAGWFRSAVAVTLEAQDDLSGIAETTWQLNDGPVETGHWLFISGDGSHSLSVQSRDLAGNSEAAQEVVIHIDTLPPQVSLHPLPIHTASERIWVSWTGEDAQPTGSKRFTPGNSGIASYDVEVQVGAAGPWQLWLSGVTETSASYTGQRGQVYAFRVRATDVAGNRSLWASAGNRVLIDPIVNGDFASRNFDGWELWDGLQMSLIQETDLSPGTILPAARLGSPSYLACARVGNLPTLICGDDWSSIAQTVTVPSLSQVARPTLSAWYRIQTYDQITTTSPIWAGLCPQLPGPVYLADSFDITAQVVGSNQVDLLWRDGNPEPQFPEPIEFRDLGWRRAVIDLSPYAGQTIRLQFANHNRLDARFNTWTDLYGIQIQDMPPRRLFLPVIVQNSGYIAPEPEVCWPATIPPGMVPNSAASERPWMSLLPLPSGDLAERTPR